MKWWHLIMTVFHYRMCHIMNIGYHYPKYKYHKDKLKAVNNIERP